MRLATAVSPNAVTTANVPSPSAAPSPETRPTIGPKVSVRRMQMRFTGPIGTATIRPIRMPEQMRTI